jgi:hypothetical protein
MIPIVPLPMALTDDLTPDEGRQPQRTSEARDGMPSRTVVFLSDLKRFGRKFVGIWTRHPRPKVRKFR